MSENDEPHLQMFENYTAFSTALARSPILLPKIRTSASQRYKLQDLRAAVDHLKYCDAVDDYPVTSLAAKRGTHQEGLYL